MSGAGKPGNSLSILKNENSDRRKEKKIEKEQLAKSLHQRKIEYEEARRRIFNEEIIAKKKNRNYIKIKKMREKKRSFKRIRNKIVSTIVTLKGDNRFFAKTKIGDLEVLALLDSGAGASCIGRNSEALLRGKENLIMPIRGQTVRTANGGETAVTGVITLPVLWDDTVRDLEFLIVPDLQQEVYLGVDFWQAFGLNVVSRGMNVKTNEPGVAALVPTEGDLSFDAVQHELTHEQTVSLDRVKAQFPSFAVLGLGKTDVEEHVIEVTDENLPVKQRFYPISPAIQKLIYAELDRMLEMGVIEESNSSWSSSTMFRRKKSECAYNKGCLPVAAYRWNLE